MQVSTGLATAVVVLISRSMYATVHLSTLGSINRF